MVTCGSDVSGRAAGTVLIHESFSAFGTRRGSSWSSLPTTTDMNNIASTTRTGFTGQEMMDNLGLVNMNGRVYNPLIGRFISADPHVTDPTDPQNFNRYSYVLNNPLSYTDPTGFDDTKCNVDQKAAQDSRGSDTVVHCQSSGGGDRGGNYGNGGNNDTNSENLPALLIIGQRPNCDAACQQQGQDNYNTQTELNMRISPSRLSSRVYRLTFLCGNYPNSWRRLGQVIWKGVYGWIATYRDK